MKMSYSESLKQGSSRVILLGSMYLLLGILVLAFASSMTLGAMVGLGIFLAIAGICEIIYGVVGRYQGQLWPHLSFGCLAMIGGAFVLLNPLSNAVGFTMVAGFWLASMGLLKVAGSIIERGAGWGWYFGNGLLSLALALLAIANFPESAFWMIGTFIGADMIFTGITQVGLGTTAQRARRYLVDETYSTLNPQPRSADQDREQHPFH